MAAAPRLLSACALTATSRVCGRRRGGVPVSHINLAKCGRVTDAALGTVCDTFAHLRWAALEASWFGYLELKQQTALALL